ncbi:MAG: hypothetical protein GY856_42495, partial [bacterium]|nr:hypothetical protein [bacterium]
MTDTAAPRTRLRIAHRLLRARDWQDRPELDRLADWWRRGAAGVCALVGIGGAGKTAIADRFLRRLPEVLPAEPGVDKDPSLPAPRELLVFSFYDAPNPDAFVAELAAWCGGTSGRARAPSYEETVRMLTDVEDLLLVLDGMERVQETGVRGPFGQITDGRLRDFVLRLAEGWLPGVRVIVTTRFRLFDPLAADSPLHFPIPVEKLAEATAVALLRQRGVCRGTDDQLRAIARGQGCHALSVDLIGGYLARFCGGDPARLPPEPPAPAAEDEPAIDPEEAAIREQEHKFARLAERYHEALARTDPAALALLQRVCLFRLGVDIGTLASIFTGGRKRKISGSGWALARLSEQQLRGRLDLLVEMKLLECSERKDDGSVVELYTVHPAVRDGFLRRLDDETARRGHDAAREGLETSLGGDPGRYPSDPATLDLLEEIVHHTLEAGHVNEAWDIYCDRIGGYKNLGWRLGAYERGERICRAFAGGRPSETGPLPEGLPENDQANFVNEWALYLNELGRLDAAVRCCERVNDLSLKKEDWENASRGNLNLTEVLFRAGRLAAGLRAAEEALQLAERADDAEERSNSHAYRGHARALRGETDAAPADFRDALHWQQEHEGKSERPLYSNRGFWHTLLLARLGQNEEATRLTEANKEILRNSWGEQHQHICRCNLVLTDLARERADLDAARELLAAAHDWAIARDAKEPLCWAAVVRAKIALNELRGPTPEQALKAARDAIEDGLRIARDCGYGIYHIDLLLLRAQVALCEGRADDAERDVRVALEEGVRPAVDSGLPALLAATDPECGYA